MLQGSEFTRVPSPGDVWTRAGWSSRVSRVPFTPQESQLPPGLPGAHPGGGRNHCHDSLVTSSLLSSSLFSIILDQSWKLQTEAWPGTREGGGAAPGRRRGGGQPGRGKRRSVHTIQDIPTFLLPSL